MSENVITADTIAPIRRVRAGVGQIQYSHKASIKRSDYELKAWLTGETLAQEILRPANSWQ
jgi:hypothetical protein